MKYADLIISISLLHTVTVKLCIIAVFLYYCEDVTKCSNASVIPMSQVNAYSSHQLPQKSVT